LKPEILDKYYGWYIAIEPDSGDYFIDEDKEVASRKAREKYPNVIHHMFGINETGVSSSIGSENNDEIREALLSSQWLKVFKLTADYSENRVTLE
jgi:hypothetical protein